MSRSKIISTLVLLLEVVLVAGIYSFLAPCLVKDHIMPCHWVANVSVGISAAVILLSILNLVLRDNLVRKGVNYGVLVISALHVFVPGFLVAVCAHENMRCNVYTQPAIVTVAGLVFILVLSDLILSKADR